MLGHFIIVRKKHRYNVRASIPSTMNVTEANLPLCSVSPVRFKSATDIICISERKLGHLILLYQDATETEFLTMANTDFTKTFLMLNVNASLQDNPNLKGVYFKTLT